MKRFVVVLALLAAPCVASFTSVVHAQDGSDSKPKKPKSKPQAQLAAKGAFPVVKAADPKVKSALAATNLAGAKKWVGKTATIVGTVDKVYLPKSNNLVLLNFAKDYKKALVGAVKSKDYAKFPPLVQLQGKKVLLSGKIINYKGAPEIEIDKAGAISLVK